MYTLHICNVRHVPLQAVLSWLSKDHPITTASFLKHADSDMACLLKCLLLGEQPPSSLADTIDTKSVFSPSSYV